LSVKGRPIHFSLKWLKPPPVPPDGSMTLFEHLKELRYRLVVGSLAIIVATIVAFAFNHQLFNLLIEPYSRAIELAKQTRPDIKADLIISGVTAPFTVAMKISLLAGLVVSAPIWLYQIWAFIVPGLLAREKKWTLIVIGSATPLFLAGIALGYYVMPKGIAVLLNFTPNSAVANLQDLGQFLSFMTRLMVVFGLAFEVPLFILMLNVVGVLPAKLISKYRSYIIFAVFVFAAVATPTPDAVTMLLLAIPMLILVILSEVLAHAFDRQKSRRHAAAGEQEDPTAHDAALSALADRSGLDSSGRSVLESPRVNGSAHPAASAPVEPTSNGHRGGSAREGAGHPDEPERGEDGT
jgi:sec-independent protein translocase protein TatC